VKDFKILNTAIKVKVYLKPHQVYLLVPTVLYTYSASTVLSSMNLNLLDGTQACLTLSQEN
jgi:hypothetical protein